jgi:hypothetical protein
MVDLTLQFMPYNDIEHLDTAERVEKLLDLVKQNKILLLEGRLKREEEIEFIKRTMEEIDETFKGVEIGTIEPRDKANQALLGKFRKSVVNFILGDRRGITIIGPASVVKEIRQDPDKIELFTTGKGLSIKNKKIRKKKQK